jgi:Uma2 family endonuclease
MTTTVGRVPMVTPADSVAGPRQGQWTYEAYAALADDGKRYEVIDGVLYMSPSPNEWHQTTVGRLFRYLATLIEDAGLGRVYIAPFDVELAFDVVVQPDVFVILNAHREKITFSRVIGAPDLVVEVVSPGTASYDRREKQDTYARTGVPEYWIADPATSTIQVSVLEDGRYRSLGIFEGKGTLPSRVLPKSSMHVERFF